MSQIIGHISQVIGPVVDVYFEGTDAELVLPSIQDVYKRQASKWGTFKAGITKEVMADAMAGKISDKLRKTNGLERGERLLKAASKHLSKEVLKSRTLIDWAILSLIHILQLYDGDNLVEEFTSQYYLDEAEYLREVEQKNIDVKYLFNEDITIADLVNETTSLKKNEIANFRYSSLGANDMKKELSTDCKLATHIYNLSLIHIL